MASDKKRFEDKPCLAIGRGFSFPIKSHILRDPNEIRILRHWTRFECEFSRFTIIVIDNF